MTHTIVVTEQVVATAVEKTVYDSPYSLDEIKGQIVAAGDAESVEEIETWQIIDWLQNTLSYDDSSIDVTNIIDRSDTEIEQQ